MKSTLVISSLLLFISLMHGQVITTNPALPNDNQVVTVTFHADQGDKGLMDYSGDDVYAHTGVITDQSTSSTDWKYVKATWSTNLASCRLTKIAENEYQFVISPGIREFYGVPASEKIEKLAFVFRNSTGSRTGRDTGGTDILTDVYETSINVSFIQPSERFTLVASDSEFLVSVRAALADSMFLYQDDLLVYASAAFDFDTSIFIADARRHQLVATVKNAIGTASDTVWYLAGSFAAAESLPLGVKDGINYIGDNAVTFVLFAPGKTSGYVMGDFNNWLPDSVHAMKKEGDRLWITLGDLTPGTEYSFQYLIDGEIRIADPYSEKVLDPDNDKYIPATAYPSLIAYPAGKTTGIVGILQPGKTAYSWNEAEYTPVLQQDLIIYELLIRDFVTTHDIKDVMDKLDYLQTLGVNAIELMPFSEFEGNSSWGYNPSFYFAPDKYYGRDTDFKDFIQECHNRGMAVIMDIVLNHAYGQNPMVRLYYNAVTGKTTPDNPWFNVDSPNTSYGWGYDFNHESHATQYFVDRVMEYWLGEYKLDGFRFDFTKGFTNTTGEGTAYDASRIAILKRIYDRIKIINRNAYMICEHFADNTEESELSDYGMMLWGNSNYNYNEATMGWLENSDFSWASYQTRGWNHPNLVSYMESHDEERLMYKNLTYGNSVEGYNIRYLPTALRRMEMAGAFFFTVPGPKMIWQFGELGYDISIDYNGRVGEKPVKWSYYNHPDREKLYLTWAKILDIRKRYPVFQTNDYALTVGKDLAIKKIELRHAAGDAIVIGNFGLISSTAQPDYTKTGWWYELFSGDSVNIVNVSSSITLDPGEYRLYTSRKMESYISGTEEISRSQISVFPNPARDWIEIDTEQSIDKIEIFDLAGIKLRSNTDHDKSRILNVSGLSRGIYLLRVQVGGEVITGRFVKN